MSFPHFSQLPCELRLEIWSYALAKESPERLHTLQLPWSDPHISYHPSPLLATNREARHEAQSYYPVRIEIIDLQVARTILDKWCPAIHAGSISGKEYGYTCYRLLKKIPRQLQQLVIGCIYLSPVHARFLEENNPKPMGWCELCFKQRKAFSSEEIMLHDNFSLPAKVLDRLIPAVADRPAHHVWRASTQEPLRRIIVMGYHGDFDRVGDWYGSAQSQVSDVGERPELLWEMFGDRHRKMDGHATRGLKSPRTQSRGQRRAMKVQRKLQRFARLQ